MYRIDPILPHDLFSLDLINLDKLTESFSLDYYLYYLRNHTEDCFKIYSRGLHSNDYLHSVDVHGYIIGKLEEKDEMYCAHLSAISISPSCRRLKFGSILMKILENNGHLYNAWFADLYVRQSNKNAIKFYKSLGYMIYRCVIGYYGIPSENAYEMRKSLPSDINKVCTARRVKDIDASELD